MTLWKSEHKLGVIFASLFFLSTFLFCWVGTAYSQSGEINKLIEDLKEDITFRGPAIEALEAMGEQAVQPLIDALKNEDWRIRDGAALVLGRTGDPRAVDSLIAALKDDPKPSVRSRVAEALADIGDPRAVDSLIAALENDRHEWARSSAARALGEIRDPRAIEPLITALTEDKHEDVRRSAVRSLRNVALANIRDPRITEALKTARNDVDLKVRKEAESALERIRIEVTTYQVQQGDSLWKIAEQFYGDGTKWTVIAKANAVDLEKPRFLRIGELLIIPQRQE